MRAQDLIPLSLRRSVHVLKRSVCDRHSGVHRDFAKPATPFTPADFLSTVQPIKGATFRENKIHNIMLASTLIQEIVIYPGNVFSFWNIVGNPTKKRGFREGRTIIGGAVQSDFGGGLCQLSGIIYHTILKAGITVTERHNHSIDIYKEEERFTPLGADATVLFGYKDFRFYNSCDISFRFAFTISETELHCKLLSSSKLHEKEITFTHESFRNGITVTTSLDGQPVVASSYKRI